MPALITWAPNEAGGANGATGYFPIEEGKERMSKRSSQDKGTLKKKKGAVKDLLK